MELNTQTRNISLVVTSCGRIDLLTTTLNSLKLEIQSIEEKILIDDSGVHQSEINRLANQFGLNYLENKQKIGQH